MLREILSITGRPGLFKIVSSTSKMLIVEDVKTKKRTPAHQSERIISLGDVAMYTEGEDLPLDEILERLYANMDGKPVDIKALEKEKDGLRDKFAEFVPDYDRDRVHTSDIRKLFQWYNILVEAGFTKFKEEEPKEEENAAADETPAEA